MRLVIGENGALLGGGGAPENGVAVREAAEARDDGVVLLGIVQPQRVVRALAEQRHGTRLIGEVLAMLEGQIEELPSGLGHRLVMAARQRVLGRLQDARDRLPAGIAPQMGPIPPGPGSDEKPRYGPAWPPRSTPMSATAIPT